MIATKEWQRLKQLKEQDRKRPLYASHLRNQETTADFATPEVEAAWFRNMKGVMNEIDWATNGAALPLTGNGRFRFLDLGCCPGGYSSYILEKNYEAEGVGISLPGGHNFLLEPELRPRYDFIWGDLVRYQLFPEPLINDLAPLPPQLCWHNFDLVILDGHPLRMQKADTALLGPRLLVCQLAIALRSVRVGGSLIMKLANVGAPDTTRIIFMLDALSTRLTLFKPFSMHATRDTFYAVAEGIQLVGSPAGLDHYIRLDVMIHGLHNAWLLLGIPGFASYRSSNLWNFIADNRTLALYRQRVQELTAPIVRAQSEALEAWHREEANDVHLS